MIRMKDFALGVAAGAVMAGLGAAESGPSLDPVKISPQLYTVRFENERLRVLEYRLKPGGRESTHSTRRESFSLLPMRRSRPPCRTGRWLHTPRTPEM